MFFYCTSMFGIKYGTLLASPCPSISPQLSSEKLSTRRIFDLDMHINNDYLCDILYYYVFKTQCHLLINKEMKQNVKKVGKKY